jgi:hypothetical protein
MITSRCAYCGTLAENPIPFAWVIDDDDEEDCLTGSIPLCVECSQSWCHHTVTCVVPCPADEAP